MHGNDSAGLSRITSTLCRDWIDRFGMSRIQVWYHLHFCYIIINGNLEAKLSCIIRKKWTFYIKPSGTTCARRSAVSNAPQHDQAFDARALYGPNKEMSEPCGTACISHSLPEQSFFGLHQSSVLLNSGSSIKPEILTNHEAFPQALPKKGSHWSTLQVWILRRCLKLVELGTGLALP